MGIFIGLWLMIIFTVTAIAIDLGVIHLARRQLQAAADAGALSGAISRTYDGPTAPDYPETDAAASTMVRMNRSFGDEGDPDAIGVEVETDLTCPDVILASPTPSGDCVRVRAYRDGQTGGSSLPVPIALGGMLNKLEYEVRASAIAESKPVNRTTCLRPILLADRWMPDGNDEFNGQAYDAPSASATTGYQFNEIAADIATGTLTFGDVTDRARLDRFYLIEDGDYDANLAGCALTRTIGDTVTLMPASPGLGVLPSLADAGPMTITVGLFSPVEWEARRMGGSLEVRIINMIGIRVGPGTVTGTTISGLVAAARGQLQLDPAPSEPVPLRERSLLRAIRLVR